MTRCISIFGPTASGKSALALRLASDFHGAIISADSMQIYQSLDIGTAKPTPYERAICPHKMIDICPPDRLFSVYDYQRLAKRAICDVAKDGYLPMIVGGTGLYLDALFFNTDFGDFQISQELRESLRAKASAVGYAALLEELRLVDPDCAAPLHPKDEKRILRALEVYYATGKPLSFYQNHSHQIQSEFSFLKCRLNFQNREQLYDCIHQRIDQMMEAGLLAEANYVYEKLSPRATARQAIGYKEFFPYFEKNASLTECVDALKTATRHYAKRQITWFRRYPDATDIEMSDFERAYTTLARAVKDYLQEENT